MCHSSKGEMTINKHIMRNSFAISFLKMEIHVQEDDQLKPETDGYVQRKATG